MSSGNCYAERNFDIKREKSVKLEQQVQSDIETWF